MKIRLATLNLDTDSIVDGEGIRAVIWTQGCIHNCLGCHNPETHDLNGGYLIDIEDVKKQIDNLEYHDGVTFSGGDPMLQPAACSQIAKYCHDKGLNVWCYTGYTFEQLLDMMNDNKDVLEFLKNIDVLIDGKFVLEEKSFDVVFRGSKNQRIIDVPKSLLAHGVVLIDKFYENHSSIGDKSKCYLFV